jgi:hypothetical protein
MKDAHKTHRRFGEKKRWKKLKKTDPIQKKASEVPDLIHLVDSRGTAIPKPKYTVLPVLRQLDIQPGRKLIGENTYLSALKQMSPMSISRRCQADQSQYSRQAGLDQPSLDRRRPSYCCAILTWQTDFLQVVAALRLEAPPPPAPSH